MASICRKFGVVFLFEFYGAHTRRAPVNVPTRRV